MAALCPVAQRRAATAVATAVALAFEPTRLGRRVEVKARADATPVVGRADVPEVLREDEEGFRAEVSPPPWGYRAGPAPRTARWM